MLRILVFITLMSYTSANQGFVFSRGITDMSKNIASIIPSIFSNLSFSNNYQTSVTLYDGRIQVNYTLSNFTFKDFYIQPKNISVSISNNGWISLILSNISFNLYYNYNETGFGINKTGQAISMITKSKLIINIYIYYFNGSTTAIIDRINITFITGACKTIAPGLTMTIIVKTNEIIIKYLDTPRSLGILPNDMTTYLNKYLKSNQYSINIKDVLLYMDSYLMNNITLTPDYVSYPINGMIFSTDNEKPTTIIIPTDLPLRILSTYANESQVIISKYTLQTYFNAFNQEYPIMNITSLPSTIPSILTTTSGYFPEFYTKYGHTNISFTAQKPNTPQIFIMNNSIILRTNVTIGLNVLVNGVYTNIVNYWFNSEYQCKIQISSDIVFGNCMKPKVLSMRILSGDNFANVLSLERFTSDLLQMIFLIGETSYFFPSIPLNYPANSTYQALRTIYNPDYVLLAF
ncbi:hypothetical protein SteCoe_26161 [Stentor coeruleus]|uniref:Lipid-binding serum glycoprotein C-terminal domain-containing protein n=1 Tax=Stentor coeruleus TaxID=5963 RepID=A0A1R2BDK8_9CILI|nr:hypothetical protein SteCoe_26161 [Stentor coeruleus]